MENIELDIKELGKIITCQRLNPEIYLSPVQALTKFHRGGDCILKLQSGSLKAALTSASRHLNICARNLQDIDVKPETRHIGVSNHPPRIIPEDAANIRLDKKRQAI